MTVESWLREAAERMAAAGISESLAEAKILLVHTLQSDRAWIAAHPDSEVALGLLEPMLERRLRREPLAYILGIREFYGRPFTVGPAVLIPRQETETLVEAALTELSRRSAGADVLDLGAGCGCIGITIALERPTARVLLSDVSSSALACAGANAKKLGAPVDCALSDGFSGLGEHCFDIIVCNPPYIPEGFPLMPEVGLYEPEVALYSGESGLEFFEMLAASAASFLKDDGVLMVECGDGQASDVVAVFEHEGWAVPAKIRDLLGIDRVIVARMSSSCCSSGA
jgi:release factor glutamine methyltransferase